jgi:uncharacterized protein
MTQALEPLARRLSLPYYDDALPAHDAFHADRVGRLAAELADDCEGSVDRAVLSAAAWFHDIGRPLERAGRIEHHGEWAAVEAEQLLEAEGVPSARIDAVTHCIRTHSIRSASPEPATLEARLLFDADKLQALGAVGVVRLSCLVGERSGRAGDAYAAIDDADAAGIETSSPDVSLLRAWARERLDALHTPPARERGRDRWEFTKEVLDRLDRERGGERSGRG